MGEPTKENVSVHCENRRTMHYLHRTQLWSPCKFVYCGFNIHWYSQIHATYYFFQNYFLGKEDTSTKGCVSLSKFKSVFFEKLAEWIKPVMTRRPVISAGQSAKNMANRRIFDWKILKLNCKISTCNLLI